MFKVQSSKLFHLLTAGGRYCEVPGFCLSIFYLILPIKLVFLPIALGTPLSLSSSAQGTSISFLFHTHSKRNVLLLLPHKIFYE